ncbi:tRNA (guanine-N(7)-)-methyltransferase non-catalytic subunit wuho [Trichinella spiralis]|uniref:tRNA (guanine-N(7)-)-methyltransferase non-catalytic subunit n=1 Tax=Trichinella spiralis TaxID=6334 RepID=A0A0V1AV98_TRISP|nr:tRNA (guanine-N(7)-)-methyltransferase non-catalytic subunit wuho [Trichinella spiralis]
MSLFRKTLSFAVLAVGSKAYSLESKLDGESELSVFALNSEEMSENNEEKKKSTEVEIELLALALDECGLFAVCDSRKRLQIFDIRRKIQIFHCTTPKQATSLVFINDGQSVIIADRAGNVYQFEPPSSKPSVLLGHISMILDLVFSPDLRYIVSCDRDNRIRVSNFPNTYNIETFCVGHKDFVRSLGWMKVDEHLSFLMSASGDGTIGIWQLPIGKLIYLYNYRESLKRLNSVIPVDAEISKLVVDDQCFVLSFFNVSACLVAQIDFSKWNFQETVLKCDGPVFDHILAEGLLYVVQKCKSNPVVLFSFEANCFKRVESNLQRFNSDAELCSAVDQCKSVALPLIKFGSFFDKREKELTTLKNENWKKIALHLHVYWLLKKHILENMIYFFLLIFLNIFHFFHFYAIAVRAVIQQMFFWKKLCFEKYLSEMSKIHNRTAIITGADVGGIGCELVRILLQYNWTVVATVYDVDMITVLRELFKEIADEHSLVIEVVDFSSLNSIQSFLEKLKRKYDKVNLLVNNAAVMLTPFAEVKNVELQWMVNFIAPTVVTNSLQTLVCRAAEDDGFGRIISVSSTELFAASLNQNWFYNGGSNYSNNYCRKYAYCSYLSYANSKLALSYYMQMLAKLKMQTANFKCCSLHPGVVHTRLYRHTSWLNQRFLKSAFSKYILLTPAEGAANVLWTACLPNLRSGAYYENGIEVPLPKMDIVDDEEALQLFLREGTQLFFEEENMMEEEWSLIDIFAHLFTDKVDSEKWFSHGIVINETRLECNVQRCLQFNNYPQHHYRIEAISIIPYYDWSVIFNSSNAKAKTVTLINNANFTFLLYNDQSVFIRNVNQLTWESEIFLSAVDNCEIESNFSKCVENWTGSKIFSLFCDCNVGISKILEKWMLQGKTSDDVILSFLSKTWHTQHTENLKESETLTCDSVYKEISSDFHPNADSRLRSFNRFWKIVNSASAEKLHKFLFTCDAVQSRQTEACLNLLALCNTKPCHEAAIKILESDQFASFADAYFNMHAHLTNPEPWLCVQLLEVFEKKFPQSESLLYCIASLLRTTLLKHHGDQVRRCKERFFSLLLQDRNNRWLGAIANLREHAHPLLEHLIKLLCTTNGTDSTILKLFDHFSTCSDKLLLLLKRIFSNQCPTKQRLSDRILAVKLIVKLCSSRMHAFKWLLNAVATENWRRDRELHVHSFVQMWNLLEHNKEIRNTLMKMLPKLGWDFASSVHAITHFSPVSRPIFASNDIFASYFAAGEFENNILARTIWGTILEYRNKSDSVLSFGIYSSGMQSMLSSSDFKELNFENEDPVAAEVLFFAFSVHQPSISLFNNYSTMYNAIWSADGTPKTVANFGIQLQNSILRLPLVNGLILTAVCSIFLWLDVSGSVYISMWYLNADANVNAVVSAYVDTSFSLHMPKSQRTIWLSDAELFVDVNVNSFGTVDFSSLPFRTCLQLNSSPFLVRLSRSKVGCGLKRSREPCEKVIDCTIVSLQSSSGFFKKLLHHSFHHTCRRRSTTFCLTYAIPMMRSGSICSGCHDDFERYVGFRLSDRLASYVIRRERSQGGRDFFQYCHHSCLDDRRCFVYVLNLRQLSCVQYSYLSGNDADLFRKHLKTDHDSMVFRKVCLQSAPRCSRLWRFDILPKMSIRLDRIDDVHRVDSLAMCETLCSMENHFQCRSAVYNYVTRNCHISKYDRRSMPFDFHAGRSEEVYLENQCVSALAYNEKHTVDEQACRLACLQNVAFICRSFVYDIQTQKCRFGPDDTFITMHLPNSSAQLMPYMQISECMDVRVLCERSEMRAQFRSDHVFDGKVVSMNGSRQCHFDVKKRFQFNISLPIVGQSKCGITYETGNVVSATVKLQYHDVVWTTKDRMYKLICSYGPVKHAIENSVDVRAPQSAKFRKPSMPLFRETVVNKNSIPQAFMRIVDTDGNIVTEAEMGQQLFVEIGLERDEIQQPFFVSSCIAYESGQKMILIDERGCPSNLRIMSRFLPSYSNQRRVQRAEFRGVTSNWKKRLNLYCNVNFCETNCPLSNCERQLHDQPTVENDNNHSGKRKRKHLYAAEDQLETVTVNQTVHFKYNRRGQTKQLGSVLYGSVAIVLLAVVGFALTWRYRRRLHATMQS